MKDTIAVIRDRYQLTIPEEIRRALVWLDSQKVVRLVLVDKDKFLVEPYKGKAVDWRKIWRSLEKIKKQGKKISLAEFVVSDRETR